MTTNSFIKFQIAPIAPQHNAVFDFDDIERCIMTDANEAKARRGNCPKCNSTLMHNYCRDCGSLYVLEELI